MSMFSPDPARYEPDRFSVVQEARLMLQCYAAFLANPAFVHQIDIAGLTKIALDEKMPLRERRRALEVLFGGRQKAMAKMADLLGVREVSLAGIQRALAPDPAQQEAPKLIINIGVPRLREAPSPPKPVDIEVTNPTAASALPPLSNGHAKPVSNGHVRPEANGHGQPGAAELGSGSSPEGESEHDETDDVGDGG